MQFEKITVEFYKISGYKNFLIDRDALVIANASLFLYVNS